MSEHPEGSPWFWKIFGGTILGAITFLLVAHITNINMSIDRAKNETKGEITELRIEMKDLRIILDHNRERVVMLEQNLSTSKDKALSLELNLKENSNSLDDKKQKIASLETTITHFKEELRTLQDQNLKLVEQVQQVREKMAAPPVAPVPVALPVIPPVAPPVVEEKKPGE